MPPVLAWSENKSSERLEQLGYGDTCRILNYYERLSEISESVKDVSVQSIHHLLSALIKLKLIASLSAIILSIILSMSHALAYYVKRNQRPTSHT